MYNRIKLNMLDERCDCEYVISRQEDWGDPYPRIFIEMYIGEGYSWDDLDTYICDPSNEENIIKLQRVSPGYTDGWHVAVLRYVDINHFASIGKFIMYVYNGEERLNLRLIYFKFSGVEESGEWIVTPNHSWEYGHITFNINGYHSSSSGGSGGGGGGGTSYTPGDGIDIENDEISVKKGDGLEITDDGALSLTQATETQRGGIILGRGLAYDSTTGKTNTVPNIQQAVIIQEKDAAYILHEYTTVEYIAGNRIGYAGADNQIIVGGYTFGYEKEQAQLYPPSVGHFEVIKCSKLNPALNTKVGIMLQFGWMSGKAYHFEIWVDSIEIDPTMIADIVTYDTSVMGICYKWTGINSKSANFPYGSVKAEALVRYQSSGGTIGYQSAFTAEIGFSSEAEYNAALGLTYEPNTLTMIVDNKEVTG